MKGSDSLCIPEAFDLGFITHGFDAEHSIIVDRHCNFDLASLNLLFSNTTLNPPLLAPEHKLGYKSGAHADHLPRQLSFGIKSGDDKQGVLRVPVPKSAVIVSALISFDTYKAQFCPDRPRKEEDVSDGHTAVCGSLVADE